MLHLETECMWNLLIADLISNGKSEKQETTKIKHSSFMIFFFFSYGKTLANQPENV